MYVGQDFGIFEVHISLRLQIQYFQRIWPLDEQQDVFFCFSPQQDPTSSKILLLYGCCQWSEVNTVLVSTLYPCIFSRQVCQHLPYPHLDHLCLWCFSGWLQLEQLDLGDHLVCPKYCCLLFSPLRPGHEQEVLPSPCPCDQHI